MTRPDDDREEARLRALFDATAEEPDRVLLNKLRARAADVPARSRRRPLSRIWAPLAALAAGVLAVLLAKSLISGPTSAMRVPVPGPVATTPTLSSTGEVAPAPATAAKESTDVVEPSSSDREAREAVAGIGVADDEGDLLDTLSEPADGDEDAWLSATGAFLEDG